MNSNFEERKVKYYSDTDLSVSFQMARIEEILKEEVSFEGLDINDAIELHQCDLILSRCLTEDAKQSDRFSPLIARVNGVKADVFKTVSEVISKNGLLNTYESTYSDYKDVLIELISDGNLYSLVKGEEVELLLSNHSESISLFLSHKKLVEQYPSQLRMALIRNPEIAARIIVTAKAVDDASRKEITIPRSLTQADINKIFSEYIASDNPHSNYLEVIARWRDDWKPGLFPEVKSAAEKRITQINDELFKNPHAGIKYGVGVQFCDDQEECIRIDIEDNATLYKYSTKWIEAYSDYPTLLNNFIHIFELADRRSLLVAAKPDNSHSVFLDLLTLNVKNKFKTGIGFNLEDMRLQGVIVGYCNLLKHIGVDVESIIEWYFNEYIEAEYGIAGFRLDLPREGTYYARCTAAFSQIERILKAYILLNRLGEIDKDVFKYLKFYGFSDLPSQIEKKYVVPNEQNIEEYKIASWSLFSDQCMLSYNPNNSSDEYPCFFDRIISGTVRRSDCPEFEHQRLDWLIEHDLLLEASGDAILVPTKKLEYTWRIWKEGCILYPVESTESKEIIDSLVNENYLCFCSTLLAPQEADYFSFFYHDKDFSNAIALRNNYSHGHDLDDDPNGNVHITSYYRALQLLIQLIVKIDNEFSLLKGPDTKIELVDWPLIKLEKGALSFARKTMND